MPTIRDVAQLAGVSVGTVSNVLNGNVPVREDTRQRVLHVIAELNYYPSAAARSLNTQQTNTVGMVRTELRPDSPGNEYDPFISDLIDGISGAAAHTGTGLLFYTVGVGTHEMELYERLVYGQQVDGLILFALRKRDPRIEFLEKSNYPYVVFGRGEDIRSDRWIDVDGTQGIALAVDHLAGLGHRHIGYLALPEEQNLAGLRWQGFVQGMAAHNLPIHEDLIFAGDYTEQSGQLGAHFLLDQNQPPTAIICNNDRMAFGAMLAIQARGLKVGKDVSVTGFDDIPQARYWSTPLTTLHQPTRQIGGMLYDLLLNIKNNNSSAGQIQQLLTPTLRIRQSTGKPR